jgi:hypothetical protein
MLDDHSDAGVVHLVVDMYVEEVCMELIVDDQDIWAGDDRGDDDAVDDHAAEVLAAVDEATLSEGNASNGSAGNAVVSGNSGSSRMADKDYRSFCAFYKSPSKPSKPTEDLALEDDVDNAWADSGGEDKGKGHVSDYSSDEDYMQPLDEDSSAEDEEAAKLRKYAHDIKRKNRASKLGIHGSQVREIRIQDLVDEVPNLDEPSSP